VEGIDLDDGEDSDDNAVMDPVEDNDETTTAPTNPDIETTKHLGEQVLEFWEKRKQKLITPLSIEVGSVLLRT
jgi:hypothetical protein